MSQSCSWIGRLVDDVNFNYGTNGNPWCWFKLAVPRDYRPKDDKEVKVDWLDFKAFNDEANYLMDATKGQLIEVHGHVENYKREREGKNEYGLQIVVRWSHNHSKKVEPRSEASPAG